MDPRYGTGMDNKSGCGSGMNHLDHISKIRYGNNPDPGSDYGKTLDPGTGINP
jgi:hypothetical protein